METCKHSTNCSRKAYSATQCRCGNVYCALHKGDHGCTYDYRKEHQQLLSNQNPRVVAPKLTDPLFSCNTPR